MALHWKVDECALYFERLKLRGWCHDAGQRIQRVEALFGDGSVAVPLQSFGRPSPDVAATGLGDAASHARFEEWLEAPVEMLGRPFTLRFTLADGTTLVSSDALANATGDDPYFQLWGRFVDQLRAVPAPATVLEIGSRARSGLTFKQYLPPHLGYVGLDILPGPNVDVVGDAHRLAEQFGAGRFAAVFSLSVFEHLAMPWKVVLELNRVLAPGGLVFTSTHQTWPPHEEPWDFWRFSRHSWQTLFNRATGFEVVEVACGEPARVHPCRANPATRAMPESIAYLGSASIVRKIADSTLTWPVDVETAAAGMYPAGERSAPPR